MGTIVDSQGGNNQQARIFIGIIVLCALAAFGVWIARQITDIARDLQHADLMPFFGVIILMPVVLLASILALIELAKHGHRRYVEARQFEKAALPTLLEAAAGSPNPLIPETTTEQRLIAAVASGDDAGIASIVNGMSDEERHTVASRLIIARQRVAPRVTDRPIANQGGREK